MKKYISVIMPCYNEKEEWVSVSIESVLKQTHSEFELVVILDNPYNNSLKILINKFIEKDLRIKLIVNEENLGLSESLNKAIAASRYDIIARIDSDDIMLENRLEVQLATLEKFDADLVASNVYFIDEESQKIGESYLEMNSNEISKILPIKDVLFHPTWLFKKQLFEKIDGYYPYNVSEDYDFLLRALTKNANFQICKEKLIFYRRRGNSITNSKRIGMLKSDRYIRKMYRENKRVIYSKKNVKNFESRIDENQVLLDFTGRFRSKKNLFSLQTLFTYFSNENCRYWIHHQILSKIALYLIVKKKSIMD